MKAITLAIILTCLAPSFSKPKFKKIDKYVPLYLCVKNLANDADDEISLALKKELKENGFQFVTQDEYKKLQTKYFEDVKFAGTSTIIPGQRPSLETIERLFRSGQPSQGVTLVYKTLDNNSVTYNTCDSIGFTIFKMPFLKNKSPRLSYFFSIKEIATNNPDSIAQFLISKL